MSLFLEGCIADGVRFPSGLVAYPRAAFASASSRSSRVEAGPASDEEGGAGCEGLYNRLQGGYADNDDELEAHQGTLPIP